jgi:hypothetical protein
MNQTLEALSNTNTNLENGEYETELTEEEFNVKYFVLLFDFGII